MKELNHKNIQHTTKSESSVRQIVFVRVIYSIQLRLTLLANNTVPEKRSLSVV